MQWKRNMDPVDFSRFKDILIEDEEGDIRPMSEPYFKAKEIAPGTWQVLSDGDYTYVLEGDDELVCIDSGLGAGNIRKFCQTLSDKPLYRLINTHGHLDHTLNNYLFDVVYMSEDTYRHRFEPFGEFVGMEVPIDYPVSILKDGDIFNLKGRPLEVYAIDEHMKGSLQFLDRKNRILFCGDELNGNFFDSRISLEHSFKNLQRWKSFRGDYDLLCAGNGIHDASYVDKYYDIVKYLLDGHWNEGEEFFIPYEDRVASIDKKNGKEVFARRAPHFKYLVPILKKAGYQKALDLNHGRANFCYTRKLSPDGPFDRQYMRDGVRVCYYINRIWDTK